MENHDGYQLYKCLNGILSQIEHFENDAWNEQLYGNAKNRFEKVRDILRRASDEIKKAYSDNGVEFIYPLPGDDFDAKSHDKWSMIPKSSTAIPNGRIVKTLMPGVRIGNDVLRRAFVTVTSDAVDADIAENGVQSHFDALVDKVKVDLLVDSPFDFPCNCHGIECRLMNVVVSDDPVHSEFTVAVRITDGRRESANMFIHEIFVSVTESWKGVQACDLEVTMEDSPAATAEKGKEMILNHVGALLLGVERNDPTI